MWFRLCLEPCSQPLAAVVTPGPDLVYWRTIDVGKFLKRKDPYSFSKRHGQNIRGQDVITVPTERINETMRLCTTTQVYLLLDRLGQPGQANLFLKALLEGQGAVSVIAQPLATKYQHAPILTVGNGITSLSEWINTFVWDVLWTQQPANLDTPPATLFRDYLHQVARTCWSFDSHRAESQTFRAEVHRAESPRVEGKTGLKESPDHWSQEAQCDAGDDMVEDELPCKQERETPAPPGFKVWMQNPLRETGKGEWIIPEQRDYLPKRIWVQQPGSVRYKAYVQED